jgi:hypothetical protein
MCQKSRGNGNIILTPTGEGTMLGAGASDVEAPSDRAGASDVEAASDGAGTSGVEAASDVVAAGDSGVGTLSEASQRHGTVTNVVEVIVLTDSATGVGTGTPESDAPTAVVEAKPVSVVDGAEPVTAGIVAF